MFAKYGEITSAVLRKADEPDDSKAHDEGVEGGEEEAAAAAAKEGKDKEGEAEAAAKEGEKKEGEKAAGAANEGENKQGGDKAAGAAEGKKPTHRGFGFVNFAEVRRRVVPLSLSFHAFIRAANPTDLTDHKPPIPSPHPTARVGEEGDGGAERAEVPRRGPGREGALRPPPPDQEGAPEGTCRVV